MSPRRCWHARSADEIRERSAGRSARSWLKRWFLANTLVGGIFALCWLLLRSGPKPSRLAYPCQQAAMSAAVLAFGVPLVSALIAARRRLAAGLRTPGGVAASALGLLLTIGVWGYLVRADTYEMDAIRPRIFRQSRFNSNRIGVSGAAPTPPRAVRQPACERHPAFSPTGRGRRSLRPVVHEGRASRRVARQSTHTGQPLLEVPQWITRQPP